jgi:hypothetical protein
VSCLAIGAVLFAMAPSCGSSCTTGASNVMTLGVLAPAMIIVADQLGWFGIPEADLDYIYIEEEEEPWPAAANSAPSDVTLAVAMVTMGDPLHQALKSSEINRSIDVKVKNGVKKRFKMPPSKRGGKRENPPEEGTKQASAVLAPTPVCLGTFLASRKKGNTQPSSQSNCNARRSSANDPTPSETAERAPNVTARLPLQVPKKTRAQVPNTKAGVVEKRQRATVADAKKTKKESASIILQV